MDGRSETAPNGIVLQECHEKDPPIKRMGASALDPMPTFLRTESWLKKAVGVLYYDSETPAATLRTDFQR